MKKLARLFGLIALASVTGLTSCQGGDNGSDNDGGTTDDGLKITMITDKGTIDDRNFNQGTWEGIEAWAEKNNIDNINYIKPSDGDTAHYEEAMATAVENGADVVICPGFLFQEAFEEVCPEYPDVKFVGIDFTQSNIAECKNTINISFQEEQAGFLAGYAAAADQHTTFGFMGGQYGPAVHRYGMGYVAGIAYAKATGVNPNAKVDPNAVWYCGSFVASDAIQSEAMSRYASCDVIFACAGGAGKSVFQACENYNKQNEGATKRWAIGVDVDEGAQEGNDMVLLSATKGLSQAVELSLDQIVNEDKTGTKDTFDWGGTSQTLGVSVDAAGIGATTRFSSDFTLEDEKYQALYKSIKDGSFVVPSDTNDEAAFNDWLVKNGGMTSDEAKAIGDKLFTSTEA